MRKAFTLIELMVTIGIIAILASFLLPLIGKIKIQAVNARCAGNLHNWGMAHLGHAQDNRGQVMSTCRLNDMDPCPNTMFSIRKDPPRADGFNATDIVQYLPGGEQVDGASLGDVVRLLGVFSCPANKDAEITGWGDGGFNYGGGGGTKHWAYSYFGHVSSWQDHRWAGSTNRPQDLTDRRPEASRLLMSDGIFIWEGYYWPNAWWVNHTKTPWTLASMTGVNQLYGDGRVQWKPREAFDLDAMWARNAAVPRIKSDDLLTYY